jgi:DNA polymerase I-like protein with 3'-5' exonuclease and polymerase domains
VGNPSQKASGLHSTKAEVMEELLKDPKCPPVIRDIVEWRSNEKLMIFLLEVKQLLPASRPFPCTQLSQSGTPVLRLQTQFLQTQSDTGRIASDGPNVLVRTRAS